MKHKGLWFCLWHLIVSVQGQVPAFPGAEGFGRFTTGGRGGVVIEVTNLSDAGTGSLRAAIDVYGPRTVVFRVSGTIALTSDLNIRNPDITIAGQTAPGDGICIKHYPLHVEADNVIIRYIRSRLGDESQVEADAIWARNHKNLIIDHCSFSWSVDETASFYDNANFTMQWCLISESLYQSFHVKGAHGYGGIWGGMGASFHHNLLAHHSSRNPRFNGSRYSGRPDLEIVDHRNNVIFNWGGNSAYGGEAGNQNMIANYYKSGPAASSEKKYRIVEPSDALGKWYITGNFVFGYPVVTQDNWKGGVQGSNAGKGRVDVPFPAAWVVTHTAENALEEVLADVGAVTPKRDSLDRRIIAEVRSGKTTYGGSYGAGKGIIDSQKDVGGWLELKSLPAPADSDHDGMPDDWEKTMGFNPNDPSDRNGDADGDGYTNLEEYLNGLCVRNDYVPAPAGLKAVGLDQDKVHLTWQEDAANETAFSIERSENRSGGFAEAGSTTENDTVFTDTGLKPFTKYYYRVRGTNGSVHSNYTNVDSAIAGIPTLVTESPGPRDFCVKVENYPNPFNPITRIVYGVSDGGRVRLTVCDMAGRKVAVLVDADKARGEHAVLFDGTSLTSGIYLARLETVSKAVTVKIMLIK